MERIVSVPYEDYQTLTKDAADKASVIQLLNTKFPDDTCQLVAIKSLLGVEEVVEPDVTDPTDPPAGTTDPSGDPTP